MDKVENFAYTDLPCPGPALLIQQPLPSPCRPRQPGPGRDPRQKPVAW